MAEAGIRGPSASGRFEATAYRIDVEDEIDFDPAIFRYRNIGQSRHTGVETLASWSWSPSLSTFASWDATRVVSRGGEDSGRQLKNIPEHVVRAGVSARLPAELDGEAVWTWTGRRWLDDANEFRLPDVSLFDLRISRSFGDFRVRVDVANLLDARYADVGFTLADFQGGEVPYVYPAAGRSVRVGIDWRR
jgi:outer membrane receptor protein involved in Fe transport